MADIDIDGAHALAHTPSLGCCGLAEKDKVVWVTKLDGDRAKCQYRVLLSELESEGHKQFIGIAPKLSEKVVEAALRNHLVQGLEVATIAREKTILNSRFDFMGKTTSGNYYVCEVKSVPLADFADVTTRERKKLNFDHMNWDEKISYFPDGYRKNKKVPVSERAVKHIRELQEIKERERSVQCVLMFVIPRTDVKWFQPSRLDQTYLNAVRDAWEAGVEIKTLQVTWGSDGICKYVRNDLPIMLFDEYCCPLPKKNRDT